MAAAIVGPATLDADRLRGATEALNLVAYARGLDNLGLGDVVVATPLDHRPVLRSTR